MQALGKVSGLHLHHFTSHLRMQEIDRGSRCWLGQKPECGIAVLCGPGGGGDEQHVGCHGAQALMTERHLSSHKHTVVGGQCEQKQAKSQPGGREGSLQGLLLTRSGK